MREGGAWRRAQVCDGRRKGDSWACGLEEMKGSGEALYHAQTARKLSGVSHTNSDMSVGRHSKERCGGDAGMAQGSLYNSQTSPRVWSCKTLIVFAFLTHRTSEG